MISFLGCWLLAAGCWLLVEMDPKTVIDSTGYGVTVFAQMNETEKMLQEINGLFELTGDPELTPPTEWTTELELLRAVKKEYKKRLLAKVPKYKLLLLEALIPDMFIQALRSRERELEEGVQPEEKAEPH